MLRPVPCARTAGILYLIIIVCGVSAGVLRESIGVPGAETAATFRLTILLDAAMAIADVGLGVLMYYLLRPVSSPLSLMALAFRLCQAAILGINLVNLAMAAEASSGSIANAQNSLDAHAIGYDIALFFFAINCLLTGILVIRAEYMPSLIGCLIGLSGLVYFAGSSIRVIAPCFSDSFAPAYGFVLLAELAFCLYLIIRGLNPAHWPGRHSTAPNPIEANTAFH